MKIYLADQAVNFPTHLNALKQIQVQEYHIHLLPEKLTTIEIFLRKEWDNLDLNCLFDYQIFPSKIMSSLTQWKYENRKMKVGDTIVQQVFIPPIRLFSQKIVFGVRVCEIFDESFRKGFSYKTLDGHVERGISSFILELTGKNTLLFSIKTFSEPGNILGRITGPLFAILYQTYCTKMALQNVKKNLGSQ